MFLAIKKHDQKMQNKLYLSSRKHFLKNSLGRGVGRNGPGTTNMSQKEGSVFFLEKRFSIESSRELLKQLLGVLI